MKFVLHLLMCFLFSFPCIYAAGQDTSGIAVHADPRIDLLMKKQAEINLAAKKAATHSMKGFRLLIINTNKREEAISAKTTVYSNFPELKAYLIYQAPFFKVKAGNFKTREEAARYQKYLSTHFPKGVFIINDIIEIKPEE